MAIGIYMGGEGQKGEEASDIRSLAKMISEQQRQFSKQAGKAKMWEKGGEGLKSLAWSSGNPLLIALSHAADYAIDQGAVKPLMEKAGDPRAILEKETPYTGGGYAEEFRKMKKEVTPDHWASFINQILDVPELYLSNESSWDKGGRVPKYYGGGSVQDRMPTIADYFGMQGKTLGGNNQQSIREMLGR